jgi:hypothetical protein
MSILLILSKLKLDRIYRIIWISFLWLFPDETAKNQSLTAKGTNLLIILFCSYLFLEVASKCQ